MSKVLSYAELTAALPRRCPALLLDRVEIIDENNIVGVKLATFNEDFFSGHFPGHPVMPGVLQVEAMKQLCEIIARPELATAELSEIHTPLIEKVKFRRPISPGDRILIKAAVTSREDNKICFSASCSTRDGVASEALLTLSARSPLAEVSMPVLFNDNDQCAESPHNTVKIMDMIPHRYPFLLIDYIQKTAENEFTAIKNISANDNLFKNFGSGQSPTMPESILCEIVAQAGAACILSRPENAGKLGFFMSIDRAESFGTIVPGDQLEVTSSLPPGKGRFSRGGGKILVNGELRFSISLTCAIVDA
jgi:3-hydroxymyristoyl/3-hydroxydecanoyl-(acyl carrier protein) dehydratase